MFAEGFAGRILPLEAAAAAHYPGVVHLRRQMGPPIEKFDALIAATALAAGASIATRDTGGFVGCGLTVIDSWTAPWMGAFPIAS
jgi:toxin FitB